ncbi:helix-turn-helix domain-containing protein, partial [Paenibacillus hemerocallicola]
MKNELMNKRTEFLACIQGLLLEMIVYALRQMEEHAGSVDKKNAACHKKVTEIIRYLNQHYAEPLSLPLLAEHFQMNLYYLSRLFKKTTGFSLTEYISAIRIKEAQRLLSETPFKVTDIAYNVGFQNIAHFGKVFKAATGYTPR